MSTGKLMETAVHQREELTRFLRSARARLQPGDVGLPVGERRRAEGLRREEVATLSGMSVTWYTWFEQGRDVQLSAPMLERLCATLRLSPQQREFMYALAQHRPPPLSLPPDDEIHPALQHLLDALSIPAQVITEDWTVIGWNRHVLRLFRDYASLPDPADRNLFKILLSDPRYRTDPDEYRTMARKVTARFKWDYSRTTRIHVFEALIAEMLERCPLFREYWHESEVASHLQGFHSVDVAGLGRITLQHSSYAVEEAPSQRLMLFAPLDAESALRLAELNL